MLNDHEKIRELLENKPLYATVDIERNLVYMQETILKLTELQFYCEKCEMSKPFHNISLDSIIFSYRSNQYGGFNEVTFDCVTCKKERKKFYLLVLRINNETFRVEKIGEYPQKELPKSRELSKFFKQDKDEYNKAVICIAHGFGVAAFAYMRRIVENNIFSLLDLIQEGVEPNSTLAKSIAELKITSPMSDRIKIANNALPDYLKPDGFNPLGQIYGLLSDGVHSLSDNDCLDKAENLQACLEFLISELATHKQNKEDFKKRLAALRK